MLHGIDFSRNNVALKIVPCNISFIGEIVAQLAVGMFGKWKRRQTEPE